MLPVPNSSAFVLLCGNCRDLLKLIPDSSVDMILTDPPYFMDYMDDGWDADKIAGKMSKSGIVSGLPVGMKFDRSQGEKLREFMIPIAREFYRTLKPGGFCAVFSLARLYHSMTQSLDAAGFEIRDMLVWKYEGQAKAFSQDHFIKKDKNMSKSEKIALAEKMRNLKTPQLKPQIEPIALAQKPKNGTFIENWRRYETGLMDCSQSLDGHFPGNVMEISKHKREKSGHPTRKPVELAAHLIRLFTREGQTVLDPFAGSGAHGMAAIMNRRKFIGFEIEPAYYKEASEKLQNIQEKNNGGV